MQKEEFFELLISPIKKNLTDINSVKKITEEFPYFQTGQILYAKLLKEAESIHFDKQVKIAAMYAAERKKFLDFIEKDSQQTDFLYGNQSEESIKELSDQKKMNLTDFPSQINTLTPQEIIEKRLEEIEQEKNQKSGAEAKYETQELFDQSTGYNAESIPLKPKEGDSEHERENAVAIKDEPGLREEESKPAGFNINKKHSFLEWLSYTNISEAELKIKLPENISDPPDRETKSLSAQKLPVQKDKAIISTKEIISRFIQEEPRISPARPGFFSAVNMARKSIEEHEDLVSPTLAEIYLLQGNFQKALTTYEKLILLYPEKNTYFAAQIQKIKKNNPS